MPNFLHGIFYYLRILKNHLKIHHAVLIANLILYLYWFIILKRAKVDICISADGLCLSHGTPYTAKSSQGLPVCFDYQMQALCAQNWQLNCAYKAGAVSSGNIIDHETVPKSFEILGFFLVILIVTSVALVIDLFPPIYQIYFGFRGERDSPIIRLTSVTLRLALSLLIVVSTTNFSFVSSMKCDSNIYGSICTELSECHLNFHSQRDVPPSITQSCVYVSYVMGLLMFLSVTYTLWKRANESHVQPQEDVQRNSADIASDIMKLWAVEQFPDDSGLECSICLRQLVKVTHPSLSQSKVSPEERFGGQVTANASCASLGCPDTLIECNTLDTNPNSNTTYFDPGTPPIYINGRKYRVLGARAACATSAIPNIASMSSKSDGIESKDEDPPIHRVGSTSSPSTSDGCDGTTDSKLATCNVQEFSSPDDLERFPLDTTAKSVHLSSPGGQPRSPVAWSVNTDINLYGSEPPLSRASSRSRGGASVSLAVPRSAVLPAPESRVPSSSEAGDDNGIVVKIKCGHFFHRDCLQRWVMSRHQMSCIKCPVCRTRFNNNRDRAVTVQNVYDHSTENRDHSNWRGAVYSDEEV